MKTSDLPALQGSRGGIKVYKPLHDMIMRNHGHIMRYDQLDVGAQKAVAWYMAVDGEAWEIPPRLAKWFDFKRIVGSKQISRYLAYYRKNYGMCRFGRADITTEDLLRVMTPYAVKNGLAENMLEHFKSSSSYHQADDKIPWPVILAADEEIIQDGWNRLTCYVQRGMEKIPAVWYPFKP